jgi:hypothetical protein
MGLPAQQRRVLEMTESALGRSDPHLTGLYAVFSRLNLGEEMPSIEQVSRRGAVEFLRTRRRLLILAGWLRAKPRAWIRAAVFLPLALGLVALSFALSPKSPTTARCTRTVAATGPARISALPRSCGSPPISPLFFGK